MKTYKTHKEILLSFPGERQQRIVESAERLKEGVYGDISYAGKESHKVPSRYTSTSFHHQPYEALVTAMHQYIDSFLKRARADLDSGNLTPYDIEFLLNDVLKRLQDQVDYARSSVESYKEVDPDEGYSQFVRENKRL
jgi:hypothetical protein